MVHNDQVHSGSGEPPQLGDSWWEAALSEGEENLNIAFDQDDPDGSSDLLPSLVLLSQPENDWNYVNRLYQGDTINGFVPSSHLLAGHKKKEYLGQIISLKIIEYDKDRCRVVLSERAAQAEAGTRLKLLDTLEEDTCIPGVVTTLTDFGAFVDLGGMEGLIHISELSWGRVDHPSDVVEIGDNLEVYILNIDREENKVALSLKVWKRV
jgi:predicted RNA-binding protein with RPS1 domain